MEPITSRQNSRVKFLRSLQQRKGRLESGMFIVEGIHAVGQAIESGAEVVEISFAPQLLTSEYANNLIAVQQAQHIPCLSLATDVFETLAEKENPQGILAVVRYRGARLEDLNPSNFAWGVALVSPQDPGNVGTILRTLDSVGADGLLLLDASLDVTHPGTVRASMGALFWHPLVSTSFSEFAGWANNHGYHIYGTSAHAQEDYRTYNSYHKPAILLMGSERTGLSEEQAAVCERMLQMPMHGKVTSLNLAVATGVMLYEMLAKL